MLRINTRSGDSGERLELEGRLTAEDVPEFEKVLAEALLRSAHVALDLSELIFLDPEGARLVRGLVARDVPVHGCSSFVVQLLGLR